MSHFVDSPNYEERPDERARALALFEEHMADVARRASAEDDVVLLMVGNIHRGALAGLMAESGEVIDVRGLEDFEWYEGPPPRTRHRRILG